MNKKKIYLAILNITSYVGQCADAEHIYGNLILCDKPGITINNVEEWNVNYLGEDIELKRKLTLDIAEKLDAKNDDKTYQRIYRVVQEDPSLSEGMNQYGYVNSFDTFEEVINVGIKKWKELELDCVFISLYEGEKYKANEYEPFSTVILNKDDLHENK